MQSILAHGMAALRHVFISVCVCVCTPLSTCLCLIPNILLYIFSFNFINQIQEYLTPKFFDLILVPVVYLYMGRGLSCVLRKECVSTVRPLMVYTTYYVVNIEASVMKKKYTF